MCREIVDGYMDVVGKEIVEEHVVMGKWIIVGYVKV